MADERQALSLLPSSIDHPRYLLRLADCASRAQFTASIALWKLVSVPSPISPTMRPLNFGRMVRSSSRCPSKARRLDARRAP